MREMMRFHARYFPGLDERVGQARAFAGFLADASQHFVAGGPTMRGYASTMQSEFELVARSPDHYVMHEHLADVNQPFYFQEFIDLLEEHDLQYLGDANFSSMLTNNLPPDLRTELEEVSPNLIVLEQYRDFVVNRLFRQSLIVRADARINRQIDPAVVNGFSIRGTIRPSGNGEWAIPQAGGLQRVVHDPLVLGILASIDDAAPQSLSFQELLDSLPLTVWDRDSSPLDRESRLAPLVFSLFASEALELRLWDPDFCPVVSERPCVFAPARLADNRIGTPSPYHITIGFNSLIQWMIPLLDGTRSAAEVSEMLALAIHDGSVTVPEPEDSDALTSGSSDELVADGLEKLRRWALLESWRQPSG
jgi:methyltransferase-like protein